MTLFCYDIFKRDDRGTPVWVEAAVDLENAKSRILELSAHAPGQYVVFNHLEVSGESSRQLEGVSFQLCVLRDY